MAGEREPAALDGDGRGVRAALRGAAQQPVGAHVEAGIARLAGALQVGGGERGIEGGAARLGADGGLEPAHLGGRAAGARPGAAAEPAGARRGGGRLAASAGGEDREAEGQGEGERGGGEEAPPRERAPRTVERGSLAVAAAAGGGRG